MTSQFGQVSRPAELINEMIQKKALLLVHSSVEPEKVAEELLYARVLSVFLCIPGRGKHLGTFYEFLEFSNKQDDQIQQRPAEVAEQQLTALYVRADRREVLKLLHRRVVGDVHGGQQCIEPTHCEVEIPVAHLSGSSAGSSRKCDHQRAQAQVRGNADRREDGE